MRFLIIWAYFVIGIALGMTFKEQCRLATAGNAVFIAVAWGVVLPAALLLTTTIGAPKQNTCEVD